MLSLVEPFGYRLLSISNCFSTWIVACVLVRSRGAFDSVTLIKFDENGVTHRKLPLSHYFRSGMKVQ
jgi:hypothetical protein